MMGRVTSVGNAECVIFDLPNIVRGFRFSLDAMWAEVSRLNLIKVASVLQMPVFFFLGRHDHWVPSETCVARLDGWWLERVVMAMLATVVSLFIRTDPRRCIRVPSLESARS